MTKTGRWTEARWLRLGDRFLTRTGYSATVVGLTIRMERVKVYNLQVNRLQLYAVGSAGVLVHNSNVKFGKHALDTMRRRGWTEQQVQDVVNNPSLIKPGLRDTRHLPGGGRMNDPATGYIGPDGRWVIINDTTGDVVQCSKPGFLPPWKN